MAVSWKTLLQMAPRLAMGFLPGLAAPGNAVIRGATRSLPSTLKGAAFVYPDLGKDFWYMQDSPKGGHGSNIGGKETWFPALNSELDRNNTDAGLAQTLQEHNQAVKGGYEGTLDEWWPDKDIRPRKDFHPSSSAVKGVRIGTDGNIYIQWHGKESKWYRYRGGKDLRDTSRIAMELLTSPSIGRALVRKGSLAHADSRDLTGEPIPDKNIGYWGRKQFDPTVGMIRSM